MKNTKKVICFLCCLLLIFSCSTISWSPHADAAAPVASYVASVVGSFILSAGFSFDNRGDFQSATEAFLESDVARGITEITTHIGNICALGNMSEPLLIHELINAGFFKDFWNSIYEFFSKGEITINNGVSAPPSGYAYYNDYCFPLIPTNSSYPYSIIFLRNNKIYCLLITLGSNGQICLNTPANFNGYSLCINNAKQIRYILEDNSWVKDYSSSYYGSTSYTFNSLEECQSSIYWSNFDLDYVIGTSFDSIFLYGCPAITEGQENIDVIGVYNNEVHTAEDIIASWARTAENGGAIDWALDSIPAYQDITSNDKDVPVTQTQSGVLTQSGVKVQTDEEVKEEVKQEAIKELENYTVTGLASIFPFCIPFDIYNFLSVLVAEREAPHFNFVLDFGSLGVQEMEIDLSGWETAAQILRTLELMAFIIGLALATHKLIKW